MSLGTSGVVKLYAINADYRKWNKGVNWYYVIARTPCEARKRFANRISWLDIYEVKEVTDKCFATVVMTSPSRYICF